MGNTGDLKQFLIKPAQFHSPSSSSKISSGKAKQTVAAGAGWDQWLEQDIFLLALSHLTATERNLRALGKEQRSNLLPFLSEFKVKEHIPQCSLLKTYQAYFNFSPRPPFLFAIAYAWLLWIKTRDRAWYLSVSLTLHWLGWATSQSSRDTFKGRIHRKNSTS